MTKRSCCVFAALLGAAAEITVSAMLVTPTPTPTATWHTATSFGGHIYSAHETNAYIKYAAGANSYFLFSDHISVYVR